MNSLNDHDRQSIWQFVQETHGTENKGPAWLLRGWTMKSQEKCMNNNRDQ